MVSQEVEYTTFADKLRSMNTSYQSPASVATKHIEQIEKLCLEVAYKQFEIDYTMSEKDWRFCKNEMINWFKEARLTIVDITDKMSSIHKQVVLRISWM